jgi:hypothetical protein
MPNVQSRHFPLLEQTAKDAVRITALRVPVRPRSAIYAQKARDGRLQYGIWHPPALEAHVVLKRLWLEKTESGERCKVGSKLSSSWRWRIHVTNAFARHLSFYR